MARILIVDDSPAQMYALRQIIEHDGHEILSADNGETGLDVALESRPDVILMDIVMPNMNGYQVTRKLRRDKTTKAIPIIFVSTKSNDFDRAWGLRQGAVAYVTKPVDSKELLDAVHSALAGQQETLIAVYNTKFTLLF